ncbi:hypothetical protein EKO23_13240 [Nocardioides guangzhouensis]|uniref:WD40 repeat domain-containing protein n=1 Tax=Nocardioides guangzhouensis TaxID=2497878 RepID=A0A4Q4ZD09_9ACTN|nr:hypothetical protein [Nocardioides guangzhouensis]RYP85216.1 hypothetical protein EKO23_13240 [Nocardioides guangzhouensis]
MVETLSERLHAAADGTPEDHFDPATVIRAGRGRVLRRRAALGGAALATLAVVGGVPLALAGGGGDGDGAPASPPPAERLTLDDASPAVEGRDYVVERTVRSADTEASGGPFVRGITPDGTTVLQRYPHGVERTQESEVGLAPPGGEVRWLAAPPGLGNYAGTAGADLVFEDGGDESDGSVAGFWLFEAQRGRWRAWTDDRGSLVMFDTSAGPVAAGSDQVLTTNGPTFQGPRTQLFRTSTAPGSALAPFATAGNVAQRGTTYAYTDTLARPNHEVTVGDLAAGRTVSFDPHTGDCRQIGVGLAADAVVVTTNCAIGDDPNAMTDIVDHIDVFDLDGRPLASLTGDQLGPVATSDRWLTVKTREEGRAGVYAYSFDDGRLLRLTDRESSYTGDAAGAGDRLVWERPVDGDHGVAFTVARMR